MKPRASTSQKLQAVGASAKSASAVTDGELFARLAEGDLAPLGALFDRYHEDVRQFLLRTAPLAGDVDDLVQETFLTASRAAGSYDGRASARPFLIGVAAQLVRRKRRTLARLGAMLQSFGRVFVERPRAADDAISQIEDEERLRRALAELSDDRRIALVMVEWNGMSGVEAARALGVPVGTVWRRLHEARAELKARLGKAEA